VGLVLVQCSWASCLRYCCDIHTESTQTILQNRRRNVFHKYFSSEEEEEKRGEEVKGPWEEDSGRWRKAGEIRKNSITFCNPKITKRREPTKKGDDRDNRGRKARIWDSPLPPLPPSPVPLPTLTAKNFLSGTVELWKISFSLKFMIWMNLFPTDV